MDYEGWVENEIIEDFQKPAAIGRVFHRDPEKTNTVVHRRIICRKYLDTQPSFHSTFTAASGVPYRAAHDLPGRRTRLVSCSSGSCRGRAVADVVVIPYTYPLRNRYKNLTLCSLTRHHHTRYPHTPATMQVALAAVTKDLNEVAGRINDADLPKTGKELAEIVQRADTIVAKPTPRPRSLLQELGGLITDVTEPVESGITTDHILYRHLSAYAGVASAFAWVADPQPLSAVQRAKETVKEDVDKLRAKEGMHEEFADAVDAFLDALSTYVQKNHPEPLVWEDDEE